jgi:hypothetical protein
MLQEDLEVEKLPPQHSCLTASLSFFNFFLMAEIYGRKKTSAAALGTTMMQIHFDLISLYLV